MTYNTAPLLDCLPEEPLKTIPEVLNAMDRVGSTLDAAGLPQAAPFNHVYRELTAVVGNGVNEQGTFDQPATVERTVGIFAHEYHMQLAQYAEGNRSAVAAAWRPLFYSRAAKLAPGGIQFAIGMGAHILYDLPEALQKSRVNDAYWPDYERVIGDMIDETAQRLSPLYVPGPARVRRLATNQIVRTIANWRNNAWEGGLQLQAAHDDQARMAKLRREHDRRAARANLRLLYGGGIAMAPLVFFSERLAA